MILRFIAYSNDNQSSVFIMGLLEKRVYTLIYDYRLSITIKIVDIVIFIQSRKDYDQRHSKNNICKVFAAK